MFGRFDMMELLLSVPAVLWAITFHEYCHAFVADRLGDRTPAMMGRLTLNPLAHLDPIGALMLLVFRFGWAKPIPVNSRYFKNPRRDIVLVSLAGIVGNLLTAFICAQLAMRVPSLFQTPGARGFITAMIYINIGLAAFNILPIPPLDGSKLLYLVLPYNWMNGFHWLERYGMFVLLGLMLLGVFPILMAPLVSLFAWIVFI